MATKQSAFSTRKTVSLGGNTVSNSLINLANSFSTNYSNTLNQKAQRDLLQQQAFDEITGSYSKSFNKLDKLPETSSITLNSNINSFYSRGADQVHEITNLMNSGHISQADGTKRIAQLDGFLNQYEELAPKLIAQADLGMKNIEAGISSKSNSGGLQLMLKGIIDDNGDIELEEKDGQMYLKSKDTGFVMNLQEFSRIAGTEGTEIIRTVPTSEDLGLDDTWNGIKGLITQSIIEDGPREKGKTTTNPQTGKFETEIKYDPEKLAIELKGRDVFGELWKTTDAEAIYYDLVKNNEGLTFEEVNNSDMGKFDPTNKEQQEAIQDYAITEMVRRNIPPASLVTGGLDPNSDIARAAAWNASQTNQANWGQATQDAKPVFDAINNVVNIITEKDEKGKLKTNSSEYDSVISQLNGIANGKTIEIDSDGFYTIYSDISGSGDNRGRDNLAQGDIFNESDIMKMYNEFGVTPYLDDFGFSSEMQKNLQQSSNNNSEERNLLKLNNQAVEAITTGVNNMNNGDPNDVNQKGLMRYLNSLDFTKLKPKSYSNYFSSKGGGVQIGSHKIDFPKSKTWKEDLIEYLKKQDPSVTVY